MKIIAAEACSKTILIISKSVLFYFSNILIISESILINGIKSQPLSCPTPEFFLRRGYSSLHDKGKMGSIESKHSQVQTRNISLG
jgi:hypothetical protein